jgi:hypothetical protein
MLRTDKKSYLNNYCIKKSDVFTLSTPLVSLIYEKDLKPKQIKNLRQELSYFIMDLYEISYYN